MMGVTRESGSTLAPVLIRWSLSLMPLEKVNGVNGYDVARIRIPVIESDAVFIRSLSKDSVLAAG